MLGDQLRTVIGDYYEVVHRSRSPKPAIFWTRRCARAERGAEVANVDLRYIQGGHGAIPAARVWLGRDVVERQHHRGEVLCVWIVPGRLATPGRLVLIPFKVMRHDQVRPIGQGKRGTAVLCQRVVQRRDAAGWRTYPPSRSKRCCVT